MRERLLRLQPVLEFGEHQLAITRQQLYTKIVAYVNVRADDVTFGMEGRLTGQLV